MVGKVLPAPSFSVIQWQLTKVTHLKLGLAEGSIGKVKRENSPSSYPPLCGQR